MAGMFDMKDQIILELSRVVINLGGDMEIRTILNDFAKNDTDCETLGRLKHWNNERRRTALASLRERD